MWNKYRAVRANITQKKNLSPCNRMRIRGKLGDEKRYFCYCDRGHSSGRLAALKLGWDNEEHLYEKISPAITRILLSSQPTFRLVPRQQKISCTNRVHFLCNTNDEANKSRALCNKSRQFHCYVVLNFLLALLLFILSLLKRVQSEVETFGHILVVLLLCTRNAYINNLFLLPQIILSHAKIWHSNLN